MNIKMLIADYHNEQHAADLLFLLNSYAEDPMGGAEPISDYVKANLISALQQRNDVFTLLCYVDDKPAGIVNFIEGFSTFKCKPLMNIHDFAVEKSYRGNGLTGKMMNEVEKFAKSRGCCKLTLEVLEGNKVAQNAYLKAGFAGYELDPKMGKALFWEKKL